MRIAIMHRLLRQKFSDPRLAAALLRTTPHPLINYNTHGDRFWGVCEDSGENTLGRLLMEIRTELARDYTHEDLQRMRFTLYTTPADADTPRP